MAGALRLAAHLLNISARLKYKSDFLFLHPIFFETPPPPRVLSPFLKPGLRRINRIVKSATKTELAVLLP